MVKDIVQDKPGVIAPPPRIYAATLLAGLALRVLFPVKFLPRTISLILGGSLISSAILLMRSAYLLMRSTGTNVNPEMPVTTIVTDGPFRFTRNPLYLSLTLLYSGIAVLTNALWAILLLPITLFVMLRGVIEREERYLEQKFGDVYLRYKARVRRWI